MTVDHVATLKPSGQTAYTHKLCRTSVHGNVTNIQNCISEPACIVSQTPNCVLLLDGTPVHISTPPSHLLNLEYFVRETLTAHARQRSHMPHYKQKRSDLELKTAGGHPATCFSQEVTDILSASRTNGGNGPTSACACHQTIRSVGSTHHLQYACCSNRETGI